MQYVNAGHPLLLHCSGAEVRALEKTGMVLGVVGGQEYGVSPQIELRSGDLLFLHTDGVDEAMSPAREGFGEEALRRLLQELRDRSAEEVVAGVERALREHTGGAFGDDFTMIAIKVR